MADDLIELRGEAIDVAALIEFVTVAGAGGVDVFLGTTRGERSAGGGELVALEYEAYGEMAVRVIGAIVGESRGLWPVVKAGVVHRTGRVGVGEASVAIAVSCPHRAEAFAACRYLIDELKTRAPIWKRAVWADGAREWV
jgi:molybdopterin synthase catalytic subunit